MPEGPIPPNTGFDPRSIEIFVCPVCHGELNLLAASNEIECSQCGRIYPIVDGIPVLIPGRAKLRS